METGLGIFFRTLYRSLGACQMNRGMFRVRHIFTCTTCMRLITGWRDI